jgi:hypothetical protein
MSSTRFYSLVRRLTNVEKITPENRDYAVEKLNNLSGRELSESTTISSVYAKKLCSLLSRYPNPVQQRTLKAIYDLAGMRESKAVSTREIIDRLGMKYFSSDVNLEFLELMGVLKVGRRSCFTGYGFVRVHSSITVNLDIMKEYYPEIEKWDTCLAKSMAIKLSCKPTRARCGDRIKQALNILGKSSLEELSKLNLPEINKLQRGDWKERGFGEISIYSIVSLRKLLRKHTLKQIKSP